MACVPAPSAALAPQRRRLGAGPQPARSPAARPRALVLSYARHSRRWWNDAWEDDSSSPFDGLDSAGGSLVSADQLTTIFCSDGSVVQLGSRPNPEYLERRAARLAAAPTDALPLPEEQGLCIGSLFAISATNGVDLKRKVSLWGFCFSTEQLFERVEDTVLSRGGEVFETQRQLKSGLHESLQMHVAIPLLFGVPPEYERLKAGIKSGGGIVERVTRHWVIY